MDNHKHSKTPRGWLRPWWIALLTSAGFVGSVFALSEALETDSDSDGWTDAEELLAGTDAVDPTDPWDSDEDGIADYLEFENGTDPLDPNDPPRVARTALARSAPSGSAFTFPSLESASSVNRWHATAWFGERLDYVFYTPTAGSAWQPVTGTEIEYWNTGYYDLCARNGSKGIAITLNECPLGEYTLAWRHMQRPDGCEPNYTVSVEVKGKTVATKTFAAPIREKDAGGEVVSMSFPVVVSEPEDVKIVFMPSGSGTKGPLVGSIGLTSKVAPTINITPIIESGIIEGPYEITRAKILLSGSIGEGFSQVFALKEAFNIPDGNLVEISVSTDDTASVTIEPLELSVSGSSGANNGKSEWRRDYGESLPISVSYVNQGASYNLSVTITVKKSLRELVTEAEESTPVELQQAEAIEDIAVQEEYKRTSQKIREVFASGESAKIKIKRTLDSGELEFSGDENICMNESLAELKSITPMEATIRAINKVDESLNIEVHFPDGDIVCKQINLKVPEFEVATEISEETYLNLNKKDSSAIDYGNHKYRDGHYFFITVYPIDVSFEGIYHWEDDHPEEKEGLLDNDKINTVHTPAKPCQINNLNSVADKAYFAATFNEISLAFALTCEEEILGKLVWQCPVRWHIEKPPSTDKNSLLPATGSLPIRIQTTTLRKNEKGDKAILTVEKLFPRK